MEDGETVEVTKETLLIVTLFYIGCYSLYISYLICVTSPSSLGKEEQGMGKFNLFILLVRGKC